MENLEKIQNYRNIIKQILSQHASYKPSHGEIEMQTLLDTEQDRYQLLAMGWNKEKRIYGCSMHLDIKSEKIWIQANNTEIDIARYCRSSGRSRSPKRRYCDWLTACLSKTIHRIWDRLKVKY